MPTTINCCYKPGHAVSQRMSAGTGSRETSGWATGSKRKLDLGLSVQFFGVISDRNELPKTYSVCAENDIGRLSDCKWSPGYLETLTD